MKGLFILIVYTIVSTTGLYKMKIANVGWNLDFIIGLAAYGLGFAVWMALLKEYPLSIAFPVAAGSLIISTQIVGFYYANESITAMKLLGVTSIAVGLIILHICDR